MENAISAYLQSTEQIGRHSRNQNRAVEVVSYLILPPLSVYRRLKLMAGRITVVAVAIAALVLIPYFVIRSMPGNGCLVVEFHPRMPPS